MFWGITLESGKKYTQVLQRSFQVTMAALDLMEKSLNNPVSVIVEIHKVHYVLCSLQPEKFPQQTLDINFTEGEKVSFFIEGKGKVHLTGYYLVSIYCYEILGYESSSGSNSKNEILGISFKSKNLHKYRKYEKKLSEVSWQRILSGIQNKEQRRENEQREKKNLKKETKNKLETKETSEKNYNKNTLPNGFINIDERSNTHKSKTELDKRFQNNNVIYNAQNYQKFKSMEAVINGKNGITFNGNTSSTKSIKNDGITLNKVTNMDSLTTDISGGISTDSTHNCTSSGGSLAHLSNHVKKKKIYKKHKRKYTMRNCKRDVAYLLHGIHNIQTRSFKERSKSNVVNHAKFIR